MVDYQMYIGMMVISNWKACNCQKDGNDAHDSCAMCERCFDIATKFKRHVNTQHIKNFMSMQSFSAENGLSEVETKYFIATLVCDDNSHKTVVCNHSHFF